MAVLADWLRIATEDPDHKKRLAAGRLILEAAIGFRRAEAQRQVIRPAKETKPEPPRRHVEWTNGAIRFVPDPEP